MQARTIAFLAGWLLAGCGAEVSYSPPVQPEPAAPPAAGGGEDGEVAGWASPDADRAAPEVVITAPEAEAVLPTEHRRLRLEGTATDDTRVTAVEVQVPGLLAVPAAAGDGWARWSAVVPLPVGETEVVVRAWDVAGRVGEARARVTRTPPERDDAAPEVAVVTPADGAETRQADVLVRGTASDDVWVAGVLVRSDPLGEEVAAASGDGWSTWSVRVPLAPGVDNTLTATARDHGGITARDAVRVIHAAPAPAAPPGVAFTTPEAGARLTERRLEVSGTASGDVAGVLVRVVGGAEVAATSGDGFAAWSATVTLAPGSNDLVALARDAGGRVGRAEIVVVFDTDWIEPRRHLLRHRAVADGRLELTLDREALRSIFPEDLRRTLVLFDFDLSDALANAISDIKGACDPACPGDWRQQEVNLQRMLAMTPRNADVSRTELATLFSLAPVVGTTGPTVLKDTLGIGMDEPIVDEGTVVETIMQTVVVSHPETTAEGRVPVTLEDALSNLGTLAERFGPAGDHPGFVTGESSGVALTEEFAMSLQAASRLVVHEGLDLAAGGKGYLARPLGGGDALDFDFEGEDAFSVTGVADQPTATLEVKLVEHDGWVQAGNTVEPQPRGAGSVWGTAPWTLEHIFATAAYLKYADLRRGCDLCGTSPPGMFWERCVPFLGCSALAELVVGRAGSATGGGGTPDHFAVIDPNPAGWVRFWKAGGGLISGTINPQYIWDLVTDIAQERLQDGGVPEGEGDVVFPLSDLSLGVTGAELVEALAPALQEQADALSGRLMAGYGDNNDPVDAFLVRGDDGGAWLLFAGADDPLPAGTAAHPQAGFFGNPALSERVSSTDDGGSGDAVHDKVRLAAGQRLYLADREGRRWRVDVDAVGEDDVALTLSRRR